MDRRPEKDKKAAKQGPKQGSVRAMIEAKVPSACYELSANQPVTRW